MYVTFHIYLFISDIKGDFTMHALPTAMAGFHGAVLPSMMLGSILILHQNLNAQMKHAISIIVLSVSIGWLQRKHVIR